MAGRPRKYTPEQVKGIIDKYFQDLGDDGIPTISGLALALKMDIGQLRAWEAEGNGYSLIAREARLRLTSFWEGQLLQPKVGNGAAFWMRNAASGVWNADKSQTKVEAQADPGSGGIKVTITCTQPGIDV